MEGLVCLINVSCDTNWYVFTSTSTRDLISVEDRNSPMSNPNLMWCSGQPPLILSIELREATTQLRGLAHSSTVQKLSSFPNQHGTKGPQNWLKIALNFMSHWGRTERRFLHVSAGQNVSQVRGQTPAEVVYEHVLETLRIVDFHLEECSNVRDMKGRKSKRSVLGQCCGVEGRLFEFQ